MLQVLHKATTKIKENFITKNVWLTFFKHKYFNLNVVWVKPTNTKQIKCESFARRSDKWGNYSDRSLNLSLFIYPHTCVYVQMKKTLSDDGKQ